MRVYLKEAYVQKATGNFFGRGYYNMEELPIELQQRPDLQKDYLHQDFISNPIETGLKSFIKEKQIIAGEERKQYAVNKMSEEELTKVPFIGEKTAKEIVKYRPYKDMEDMITKAKLHPQVANKLKEQTAIVFD